MANCTAFVLLLYRQLPLTYSCFELQIKVPFHILLYVILTIYAKNALSVFLQGHRYEHPFEVRFWCKFLLKITQQLYSAE